MRVLSPEVLSCNERGARRGRRKDCVSFKNYVKKLKNVYLVVVTVTFGVIIIISLYTMAT